jgi:Mrp family chromosome partitioning ATPase
VPSFPENQPYGFSSIPDSTVTILNFNTESHMLWKLIRVDYLQNLFGSLRSKYDYIIVDCSPCGLTAEPAIIAQAVDAALLVIRQDTVRVSRIMACLDTLLQTKVNLLGCILNGVSSGLTDYGVRYRYGHSYRYGRYGYGYGYGYGGNSSKKQIRSKSANE